MRSRRRFEHAQSHAARRARHDPQRYLLTAGGGRAQPAELEGAGEAGAAVGAARPAADDLGSAVLAWLAGDDLHHVVVVGADQITHAAPERLTMDVEATEDLGDGAAVYAQDADQQ